MDVAQRVRVVEGLGQSASAARGQAAGRESLDQAHEGEHEARTKSGHCGWLLRAEGFVGSASEEEGSVTEHWICWRMRGALEEERRRSGNRGS